MNFSAFFRTIFTRRAHRMKKVFSVLVVFCVCIYAAAVSAEMKSITVTKEDLKKMAATSVVIETKFGNMTLKFFPDVAPGHVKNFLDLAKSGFYDKTTFHRVIPGFMIQGGDPSGNGTGGPGYTIKAEFNEKPHKRGIVSMARTNDPNSAGSQFFICVKDSPFLDRQYTVFGEVVSGMEVADKITSLPRNAMDKPNERVEIKVKVIEEKP
jgi:peptidyl-prolyl cis-trans isomerase B (cyclophilin B)